MALSQTQIPGIWKVEIFYLPAPELSVSDGLLSLWAAIEVEVLEIEALSLSPSPRFSQVRSTGSNVDATSENTFMDNETVRMCSYGL